MLFAVYHFLDIFGSIFPTLITLDYIGHIVAFIVLVTASCTMHNGSDGPNIRECLFKIYLVIIILLMGPFLIFRIIFAVIYTEAVCLRANSDGDIDCIVTNIPMRFMTIYSIRYFIWIVALFVMLRYKKLEDIPKEPVPP